MSTLQTRARRSKTLRKLIGEVLSRYEIQVNQLASELEIDASRLSHWKNGRYSPQTDAEYEKIYSHLKFLITRLDNVGPPTLPEAPVQGELELADEVPMPEEKESKPVISSALDIQIGGSHYRERAIQPVQYIEANGLGFLEGCVVKRVTRHDKDTGKGEIDIDKAIHELQLLKELRYGGSCE